MSSFRIRYQRTGAHILARLFSGPTSISTHALNGNLRFTESEWEAFLRCFDSHGNDTMIVTPDDHLPGEPN